jgi:hypothetical protein
LMSLVSALRTSKATAAAYDALRRSGT